MKRVLIVAAVGLATFAAARLVRRLGPAIKQRLMQRMMNRVAPKMMASMPRMMDMCFGSMPADQREFMLAHCRGMLDGVEAKYVSTATEPATSGANVA